MARPAGTRDLTSGPIGWTLLMFSLPVMGSNILQSLNGSANAFWVSHSLGEAALTATSNANIILFFLLGSSFGVSMAANLLIAQAVGAGDRALAKRVIGTSTLFFIALSMSIGVAGFMLTPAILQAVNTPMDARADAVAYLRVIFTAMPFMFFFSYLQMAQRGAGDARTPFYFSLMTVALDIGLNPVLIRGLGPAPQMGIAGSSTATLIAQTLTLTTMIVHLYRTDSILVLKPSEWRLLKPDLTILRSLLVKGMPMGFQMLVISGAAIVMISMVNGYGSQTSAAYGAASQIWTYVQMPAMAIGAAVSSMAAQNVGAGRMDRVDRIAGIGVLLALLATATPVAATYLFTRPILHLFLPAGSASLDIAVHLNGIIVWGFVMFSLSFVLFGVVRATGAVTPPLIMLTISLWVIRVPFAKLLIPYIGPDAIWWSFPLGSFTSVALAALYYRFGGWRKAKLLDLSPRGVAAETSMATPAMSRTDPEQDLSPESPSAPNRPTSGAPAE